MLSAETPYYAEISILVDGWPWNLSEFDFRRWFAPGAAPAQPKAAETMGEIRAVEHAPAVSENRRVAAQPTYGSRRRKRKQGEQLNEAKQAHQGKRAKRAKHAKPGRKVA